MTRHRDACTTTTGIEIQIRADRIVANVYGVLDAGGARELCCCLDSLWDAGLRRIDLDLSALVHAPLEGELLVERWATRARGRGGRIRVTPPPAPSPN
jgi:hypothetical protein